MSGFGQAGAGELSLPRAFGRLLLLKLLARGGMGDVYLAATTGIEGAERPCVVKTVRRDHVHDGSFLARFLDEARVQSQLNHPGVAQVLEASTDSNGEPYTVVEYVEGRSLAEVRQRAVQLGVKLAWPEAVALALEMAQALAHVHERSGADGQPLGIVHRDLSPQNVMIGYAGEVKLIDFGTARGHNRRCHTVAGVVFAKPGYVAPEVARQQVGDGRIDLYALGVMLWELCAGKRLLAGDPQRHLEDVAAGKVIVPKIAARADAPATLDDVIARLTANEPEERYACAARAVPELARVLSQAPTSKGGERGVRPRIALLMRGLWPHEPGRGRAEFARLLGEARKLRAEVLTPHSSKVSQTLARATAEDDPNALPGTPYRVVRRIGEGASGIVYEAEHVELGRKVALKVLAPEHAAAQDAIERFRGEARAVAKLSHPNLVALYDFGRALDGRIYLAMELLAGEPLDRRLKREGPASWTEAVRVGVDATRALEAAHAAGLVHRDLKPANLFVTTGGTVKLLDFGVAMALAEKSGEAKKQQGFAIFGTPEYMAPEQVSGDAVDGRCDVYSLGCVLYELLTGTRPFSGESSVVVLGKQIREAPEPPRQRAPGRRIPLALEDIVLRALAKRREDRFFSAAEMREALERVLREPVRRRSRARIAALGVLASAALVGIVAVASTLASRAPAPAQAAVAVVAPATAPTPPATAPVAPPAPASLPRSRAEVAATLAAGGAVGAREHRAASPARTSPSFSALLRHPPAAVVVEPRERSARAGHTDAGRAAGRSTSPR